jgi:hypothetical protein
MRAAREIFGSKPVIPPLCSLFVKQLKKVKSRFPQLRLSSWVHFGGTGAGLLLPERDWRSLVVIREGRSDFFAMSDCLAFVEQFPRWGAY